MESDLSIEGKLYKQRMVIFELLFGLNGYVNYSQEKWLGFYLVVCKFFDFFQVLLSGYLLQFQFYCWVFEGEVYNMIVGEEKVFVFKFYIVCLEKLFMRKRRDYGDIEELQCIFG